MEYFSRDSRGSLWPRMARRQRSLCACRAAVGFGFADAVESFARPTAVFCFTQLNMTGGVDMRREAHRSPATPVLRAKVVLVAMALAAAVVLVAVGSWPLKVLIVLAFVRGLFASDLLAIRSASDHRRSTRSIEPAPGRDPRAPMVGSRTAA